MMNARQSRLDVFQEWSDEYKLNQIEAPGFVVGNEETQGIQLAWLCKPAQQTFLNISESRAKTIIHSKIWF